MIERVTDFRMNFMDYLKDRRLQSLHDSAEEFDHRFKISQFVGFYPDEKELFRHFLVISAHKERLDELKSKTQRITLTSDFIWRLAFLPDRINLEIEQSIDPILEVGIVTRQVGLDQRTIIHLKNTANRFAAKQKELKSTPNDWIVLGPLREVVQAETTRLHTEKRDIEEDQTVNTSIWKRVVNWVETAVHKWGRRR